MAESHADTAGPLADTDELVVRPARVRMALLIAFLLVCVTLSFIEVWNNHPLFPGIGYPRIVALGFLIILTILTVIVLIGLFSPFPLFSVSHAGIRTYSMFGWFGSELTPWSEVTQIKIELRGGPRSLTIYSQQKPARNRLTRWLNRKGPGRMRASVLRGMTAGPFDTMVDQLLERYEHEIDEYGIQALVNGDE